MQKPQHPTPPGHSGEWEHFEIREGDRIVAAAAYRPGEYVYCQIGPDNGLQAAADRGLARFEVRADVADWDELDTFRALFFGPVDAREGSTHRTSNWGPGSKALEQLFRIIASDLDEPTGVTSFVFPTREIRSHRLRPDSQAREARLAAEAAARARAAEEEAARAAAQRVSAQEAAELEAAEAAVRAVRESAAAEDAHAARLADIDPFTYDDLLAALTAASGGPYVLRDWGRTILSAAEQIEHPDRGRRVSFGLFGTLRDAAVKRHQAISPFEGMLEAPPEVIAVMQQHRSALEHLAASRDEVLDRVVHDLAQRVMTQLDGTTWGELARHGAIREQPATPAGYDEWD